MKSALFVDFDNVYSGLRKLDPTIAERFARQPLEWLRWLTDALALPEHASGTARRRILVRRCYFNPQVYQRFRPSFNRAGFEIIDCPAMTSEGKTSTDIHMVLDIVDLLQHEAHYDEFIVLSADADFTPVLRKLRRWDRRTTVLAIGFPSAAYQASADLLIDQDDFVRDALGFQDDDEPSPSSIPLGGAAPRMVAATDTAELSSAAAMLGGQTLVSAVARAVRDTVDRSPRAVSLSRLAAALPELVTGLDKGSWAGSGSFRRLIDSLDLHPLQVTWAHGGYVHDPRRQAPPARAHDDDGDEGLDTEFSVLVRQVHDATGAPLLTAAKYRVLFESVVADLALRPFQLRDTGKSVRDRCRDAGQAVSRGDVNWVLRGLLLGGHAFGQGQDDVSTLSSKLSGNVLALCRREQLTIDETGAAMIGEWFGAAVSS
jgi:hypothetical protein